jgi:integrase
LANGKNKLTALALKNATGKVIQDGGGLMLVRAADGETGAWTYRYSLAGKRRDMGLGSYPDVTLAAARRERDKWQAVLLSGIDPIAERKRRAEEALRALDPEGPTLSQLVATVFEARKSSLRGEGQRGRWLSPLTRHVLPVLGNRRVSGIHQTDIRDVIQPIWKAKHETAAKAIQRLRIVFKAGRLAGHNCDPFTVEAARYLLGEVHQEATPIPATRWQDIPDLFKRLGANPTISHRCLQLAILTGLRGDAVRGARLEEFNGNVWTVPADRIKGRVGQVKDFRVPLSDAALAVVEECKDLAVDGFLFANRKRGGGFGPVSANAIEKALTVLGEAGRPHGFRTSFRTWVQDTEVASRDVIEATLGHSSGSKVERAYARSDLLDQRRILAEKWAAYVTGQTGVVVPIRAETGPQKATA